MWPSSGFAWTPFSGIASAGLSEPSPAPARNRPDGGKRIGFAPGFPGRIRLSGPRDGLSGPLRRVEGHHPRHQERGVIRLRESGTPRHEGVRDPALGVDLHAHHPAGRGAGLEEGLGHVSHHRPLHGLAVHDPGWGFLRTRFGLWTLGRGQRLGLRPFRSSVLNPGRCPRPGPGRGPGGGMNDPLEAIIICLRLCGTEGGKGDLIHLPRAGPSRVSGPPLALLAGRPVPRPPPRRAPSHRRVWGEMLRSAGPHSAPRALRG